MTLLLPPEPHTPPSILSRMTKEECLEKEYISGIPFDGKHEFSFSVNGGFVRNERVGYST